jgi:8-oxo-dGTP pyrophosphatase MutT (NUDIX family)
MSPALSRLDRIAAGLAARTPRVVEDPTRKLAAVAVILVPDPDAVLLIRRAEREGDRWSGQMAFPGGRWAREDSDLIVTARRETREETGVVLEGADLIGRLDDSAPRTPVLPPVIVTPYVFRLEARQPLILNHEVAAAEWVPLDDLVAAGVYRPFAFESQGVAMYLPGYHLKIGTVWGLTERVMTPILALAGAG